MMPKSTRIEMTYTERRVRVAIFYLKGFTQTEIAQMVSVNQSTISRDLQAIKEQWQVRAADTINEVKIRELQRIDELEREYWQAWRRSQEDEESVRQKGTPTSDKGKAHTTEVTKTVKGQVGNATFLEGVQWCIEQRLRIFGIYAPTKLDTTWRQSVPDGINPDEVFEADVQKMLQLLVSGEADLNLD